MQKKEYIKKEIFMKREIEKEEKEKKKATKNKIIPRNGSQRKDQPSSAPDPPSQHSESIPGKTR